MRSRALATDMTRNRRAANQDTSGVNTADTSDSPNGGRGGGPYTGLRLRPIGRLRAGERADVIERVLPLERADGLLGQLTEGVVLLGGCVDGAGAFLRVEQRGQCAVV